MHQQIDLNSWDDFEQETKRLFATRDPDEVQGSSELLFRGQASAAWQLETTLERAATRISSLACYFQFLSAAKPQLETFTGKRWPDLDIPGIRRIYEQYDSLNLEQFPAYELCVYSRHHGFPSPLLDWTRSPYIAAFFALQSPTADRVAIWVYQERHSGVKAFSSGDAQIKNLGPYVTSHPRHFLQQGQYTLAVKFENEQWQLARHHEVFDIGREGQDQLTKLTLPRSARDTALIALDRHNINAYSLLQSEDALLQTIAFRLLPRYR